MNLALRGIEANLGPQNEDTFRRDLHPDLRADFVLANPPFNMSDWSRNPDDPRWRYGVPPAGNANFAWVQHIVHHLAPQGIAGFVLANGSMSAQQSGEGEIRKGLVEDDLVDCMVALPPQLFYGTAIPACLWFLIRDKSGRPTRGGRELRDRRGETLFVDARKLGVMVSRTHRELTDEELARTVRAYHAWRGEPDAGEYEDVPGFCRGATLEEIRGHGHVLTPGRYVGAPPEEDDGEPFEEKVRRLVADLEEQFAESERLADVVLTRMQHNLRESQTLAELRDTLLPKLISGEVRLRDAGGRRRGGRERERRTQASLTSRHDN
jgi:type I restriction enzyme M protein